MLLVLKASGEEALALQFEEFVQVIQKEQPVTVSTVLALKRYLHHICGQPRFRQRLLLPDGITLSEDDVLEGPMDIQLILLPFDASTEEQIQRLQQAARENNIATTEQLLHRPQDPELVLKFDEADLDLDEVWLPPLHAACDCGSVDAARLLLEASADKDKALDNGTTPLFMASKSCHLPVVQLLLEASADKNKPEIEAVTPVFVASQMGHSEVVQLLLQSNADKDRAACDGATPLFVASEEGHLPVVQLLLEAGANKDRANMNGETPSLAASKAGHVEVVQLLASADKDKALDNGTTPLFLASQAGRSEVVRY